MKFEHKGKWVRAITESKQKNEAIKGYKDLKVGHTYTFTSPIDYGYFDDWDSDKDFQNWLKKNGFVKGNEIIFPRGTKAKLLKVGGPGGWPLFDIKGEEIDIAFDSDDIGEYLVESSQKNESTESVQVMLDKSLSEENKAVADYLERAAKCKEIGDTKAAELFEELARDESVHVAQLAEAKELFGYTDAEVEQEGSKEAQELLNKGEN